MLSILGLWTDYLVARVDSIYIFFLSTDLALSSFVSIRLTGVADGVGGWRNYGIDAGEFSNYLMRTCERIVQSECFNPQQPVDLLANSYYELLEQKKPILGKHRWEDDLNICFSTRRIYRNHVTGNGHT